MEILNWFASLSLPIIIAMIIGVIIIQGKSLWKAAKRNDKNWFWVLVVLNGTVILPIYYLLKK